MKCCTSLLALLLAGYYAQKYLPDPPPKIAGIDLGTTYSSIGVYHPASGNVDIVPDSQGRKTIPSVVAFLPNGTAIVGHAAQAQAEHNPQGTIYDAKRFIGKTFDPQDKEFLADTRERYPFQIELDENGRAYFMVPLSEGKWRKVYPEEIGAYVISYLRDLCEKNQNVSISKAVISVPAEFNEAQRNATRKAAELAGIEIYRVISEPTAAALAYGLHKKEGIEHILVVDLGGGTLDVSLLWLQAGTFITRAMAGNNRLGGQDFNLRLLRSLLDDIKDKYDKSLSDAEDIQNLRTAVEAAKLKLTYEPKTKISLYLKSFDKHYEHELTRGEFELLNGDLFEDVLEPVRATLEDADIDRDDVDETVLVGGSTRIPKVRQIVGEFFGKAPNFGVDPELAVVTGVTVQAGVVGGGWPLQVAATELPAQLRKIHVYGGKKRTTG